MLTCKIGGVKIHSTDLKNYSFLKHLKDKNTRIIVGVGGSTLPEIEKAVKYLGKNEIVVMSGFQAEPNLIEDIELNKIGIIKKSLGVKVGYTDHIEVTNPLTKSLSAMAVLMGADYIEKHLTIERDYLQLEDFISALNPAEFKEMVQMIRDADQFPDPHSTEFDLTEREKTYRKSSKKVVLAVKELAPGTLITEQEIVMLRTAEEYDELMDVEDIMRETVAKTIEKNKIIRKEFLK